MDFRDVLSGAVAETSGDTGRSKRLDVVLHLTGLPVASVAKIEWRGVQHPEPAVHEMSA
jgi:hypothetical protein